MAEPRLVWLLETANAPDPWLFQMPKSGTGDPPSIHCLLHAWEHLRFPGPARGSFVP